MRGCPNCAAERIWRQAQCLILAMPASVGTFYDVRSLEQGLSQP